MQDWEKIGRYFLALSGRNKKEWIEACLDQGYKRSVFYSLILQEECRNCFWIGKWSHDTLFSCLLRSAYISWPQTAKMKCRTTVLEPNIRDKDRRNILCLLELCTHVGVTDVYSKAFPNQVSVYFLAGEQHHQISSIHKECVPIYNLAAS